MTDRKGTVMPATMTHKDQFDEGYKHGYHEGYLEGKYAGYKMGVDLGRAEAWAWLDDNDFTERIKMAVIKEFKEYHGLKQRDDATQFCHCGICRRDIMDDECRFTAQERQDPICKDCFKKLKHPSQDIAEEQVGQRM